MFKTLVTAAAIALTAAAVQAAPSPADLFQLDAIAAPSVEPQGSIDTAYYCEWVTLYDYWGNWVTVYQCY